MNESRKTEQESTEHLPEVLEGYLDAEGLLRWRRDLEQCASVIDVRVKTSGSALSGDQQMDLAHAIDALLTGSAGAVQIRYGFDDQHWCDTAVRHEDGARIIRTRLTQPD